MADRFRRIFRFFRQGPTNGPRPYGLIGLIFDQVKPKAAFLVGDHGNFL